MPTLKLTDAFVRGLKSKPGVRLQEFRDEALHGLELRVSERGSKCWRLHYTRRSDGKRRAVMLGSYPALALKEARRRAKQLQAEIEDEGKRADPASGVKARREAETFEELVSVWIERHGIPNKSPRALNDDLSMLARHVLPEIGQMKAQEITKRDVIQLIDKVAAKSDARQPDNKTRKLTHRPNRVFELVRSIFRWAAGRDLVKFDPTFGLGPPIKSEKPRDRELSEAEIRQLWTALGQAPVTRRTTKGLHLGERAVSENDLPMTKATALALKLALVTAQRIGEVTGTSISELTLSDTAAIWIIPGERSKNGQSNRVPLSPVAVQLINEARELNPESAWLFPSAKGKGPIDPHAPTKALDRSRLVIGLNNFRIHDLRRTAATRMAEIGVSPHTISLVLNHVSARRGTVTGKVYNQYSYDKEKRDALEAWGRRLVQLLGGTS